LAFVRQIQKTAAIVSASSATAIVSASSAMARLTYYEYIIENLYSPQMVDINVASTAGVDRPHIK